ncbi:unannotated protein [freshwater metagenome]|uniref:Unannotated protein n=1 Tax=freshwater metagenome TaxID=449393 RepID=A0A6J7DD42_9ZZZZ|nr:hypothetical protein [Actinomycetota bacterium]MUH57981.1 hypothetical protein [Actinomycetota bacterium]
MENKPDRVPDSIDKAFGLLDHALDVFHDKVLRPIFLAARTIAFGFVLVSFGVAVFVALLVGVVRLLNIYCFAGKEWLSYLALGSVLLGSGLIVWRSRKPVPQRKSK